MGRSMGSVAEFKPPTMNELPIPQGSWSEAYSKKQRMYNLHLLAGVAFTAGTVVAVSIIDLRINPLDLMAHFLGIADILHVKVRNDCNSYKLIRQPSSRVTEACDNSEVILYMFFLDARCQFEHKLLPSLN